MYKRKVTVFDFDGTLTRDDTFISFARHSLGDMRFVRGIILASPWLVAWKLGMISGSKAKEKLYSFLYKGLKKERVMAKAKDFFPQYRENILSEMKRRKERGEKVYIISASLDLWMEEVTRKLDVNLICTNTSVDSSGQLDGNFSSPNCHGEEKLRRLLVEEGDKEKFHLTVYGDEPDGGDAALFRNADKVIEIQKR
ncbi:MAG: haloacid dehalogenase-like hydrolase [Muribaculaceae bacterium]|nr:haloacid dehalogenase-like hydrolase [Muribaculaceae bacterium]